MKKVLIICPYFPPVNAADMHRVRMSLPYFGENSWKAEIVTVDPKFSDFDKDIFLVKNLPEDLIVHQVSAFSKKWTSKIGIGSIALRSVCFYRKYVDQLLKKQHFDLIYFSTTQFPLLILGAHWKKKFNIPYVIDMQDPWHSTYYEDKPKHERPPKYWFSYRLNKYLEPIAMRKVNGLISVSQGYIDTLVQRYSHIKDIPSKVLTFGAFKQDFEFVKNNLSAFKITINNNPEIINLVYIGRAGADMKDAIEILFSAFKEGLAEKSSQFGNIRFHFIGTSYAAKGQGISTIKPIAVNIGIGAYVNESTDRVSFYDTIYTLLIADALVIIGSDDPQYTASKIYPYILAQKPLLALLNKNSSAAQIIEDVKAGIVIHLDEEKTVKKQLIKDFLNSLLDGSIKKTDTDWQKFDVYSARNMSKEQCKLFDQAIL